MRAGFQRETAGSSPVTTPTVPQSPATLRVPTAHCAQHAPWVPHESLRLTLPKPRDFWQPRRSPRAATLWGLSGTQGSLAAQRRRTQPLPEFREKTASTAFSGSAQKQHQGSRRGDLAALAPPGSRPCTRRPSVQRGFCLVSS